MHRRAAAARWWRARPLDETGLLGLEVLADGGVGEVEVGRHLGRGQRVGRFKRSRIRRLASVKLGHGFRLAANTKAIA